MSNKLKVKKAESRPRRFDVVKVSKHNIAEVATWMGAAHYEINYDVAKKPRSVKFFIQNRNPVLTMVGGYIVKLVRDVGEFDGDRFFGVSKNDFKRDNRKGWS